jgi:hypothetical protein
VWNTGVRRIQRTGEEDKEIMTEILLNLVKIINLQIKEVGKSQAE